MCVCKREREREREGGTQKAEREIYYQGHCCRQDSAAVLLASIAVKTSTVIYVSPG